MIGFSYVLITNFEHMARQTIHKIKFDTEEEGNILGISSGFADYRMAWELNNKLDIQLLLSEQILEVFDKKSATTFPFRIHHCYLEETLTNYYLIRNKQHHVLMVQERPQIDYYLFIKELHKIEIEDVISQLRSINGISAVFDFSNEHIEATDYLTF